MRKYDIMYIIRPTLELEQKKALVEEMNALLNSKGAESIKTNEWGTRELAYEINDLRKGYYVVLEAMLPIEAVNEFDRVAKIKENIIRHIIVSREDR
jgi:small subunit ribosomal protein S6